MSGSVNKVILVGNVGRDPEIRTSGSGAKIANFTLATSDRWRDRTTNEQRERTEWHRVVVFSEGLVGIIEKYVHKGSKLYLEGSLQTRKWTDSNGVDKWTTEVRFAAFWFYSDVAGFTGRERRRRCSCRFGRLAQSGTLRGSGAGRRSPLLREPMHIQPLQDEFLHALWAARPFSSRGRCRVVVCLHA